MQRGAATKVSIGPMRNSEAAAAVKLLSRGDPDSYGASPGDARLLLEIVSTEFDRVDVLRRGSTVIGAVRFGYVDEQPFPDTEVIPVSKAKVLLAGGRRLQGAINELAVRSDCQGHGVGRALVQHAVRELALTGVQEVQLTVLGDNPSAVHLYTSMGFVGHESNMTGVRVYKLDVGALDADVDLAAIDVQPLDQGRYSL